jgi:hypothetical protein
VSPALATGEFAARVDFSTLVPVDLPGRRCQLTVRGVLVFSGTLVGEARGQTTAMVLAPCAEVASVPPGTHRDVFRFEGTFSGTVDGDEASGRLIYAGVTHPGGHIDARIRLTGDASASLRADATVAVGGDYIGIVKTGRRWTRAGSREGGRASPRPGGGR